MKNLKKFPFLFIAAAALIVGTQAKATTEEAGIRFTVAQWVNLIQIFSGKQIEANSENADVRDYAKNEMAAHQKLAKELGEFATKQKLKPVNVSRENASELEKELKMHLAAVQKLRGLKGAELDKAYVDLVVKVHALALKNIELAASSLRDTDEGKYLADLAPQVKKDMEDANKLAEKLKKSGN